MDVFDDKTFSVHPVKISFPFELIETFREIKVKNFKFDLLNLEIQFKLHKTNGKLNLCVKRSVEF